MSSFRYIKGVKVDTMSKVSSINHHVKEPAPFPKVSNGYENLAQVIFTTQVNNLFMDLTKEMVKMKAE